MWVDHATHHRDTRRTPQEDSGAYVNVGVAPAQGLDDLAQLLGSEVTARPMTALWVGGSAGSDWSYQSLSFLHSEVTQ